MRVRLVLYLESTADTRSVTYLPSLGALDEHWCSSILANLRLMAATTTALHLVRLFGSRKSVVLLPMLDDVAEASGLKPRMHGGSLAAKAKHVAFVAADKQSGTTGLGQDMRLQCYGCRMLRMWSVPA